MSDSVKPALCADTQLLLNSLRGKMGFPAEFYAYAVPPVIEAFAVHVKSHGDAPGQVSAEQTIAARLEMACLALDYRRGRILPPHAAPEDIGARMHRWTYAVFVAALLLPCTSTQPADAASRSGMDAFNPRSLYEQVVPRTLQDWLRADSALHSELCAVMAGVAAATAGPIADLIRRAAAECARRHGEVAAVMPAGEAAERAPITARVADNVPASPPQPLPSVQPSCREADNAAARFMRWVASGIADGSLHINEANAMVHFVTEGMLLVSPRIFKAYARRFGEEGESGASGDADESGATESGKAPASAMDESRLGKILQRHVLRAGWHARSANGVNMQAYTVLKDGRPAGSVCGVLITAPERFINPLPTANPALLRQTLS